MTTRRGFLGAILAAAAAPAIVRSGILMPVRAPIAAPEIILPPAFELLQGELGSIDGFRFIEQRELPPAVGDTIKFRRYNPFQRSPFVSVAGLNAAWERMRLEDAERRANPLFAIVHPSWAADLRAAGVPVAPDGWSPPRT